VNADLAKVLVIGLCTVGALTLIALVFTSIAIRESASETDPVRHHEFGVLVLTHSPEDDMADLADLGYCPVCALIFVTEGGAEHWECPYCHTDLRHAEVRRLLDALHEPSASAAWREQMHNARVERGKEVS
jgi:hypothetical protein